MLLRKQMGLYTIGELAKLLEQPYGSVYRWIDKGEIPPPDVKCGKRMLYSADLYNRIICNFKEICK